MAEPQAYARLNYLDPHSLLERYPRGGVTVLLRHAERYPFEQPGDVIAAGLTRAGIEQARQFGARLGETYRDVRINSSPIPRCLDTGRYILEAAGLERPMPAHWWLFSPFLREDVGRAAGVHFSARVGDDDPPFPDSIYLPERLEILARRIHTPTREGELYLYIAHDTTVLPMLAYLLGIERVNIQQMPSFLEGIALVRRDGRLELDDPAYYRP